MYSGGETCFKAQANITRLTTRLYRWCIIDVRKQRENWKAILEIKIKGLWIVEVNVTRSLINCPYMVIC